MKRCLVICCVLCIIFSVSVTLAAENARMPAIKAGSVNLIALQRTGVGWEGTWYWYVGSSYNATNLTGVTALGLLEAFRDVKDPAYLTAAEKAASFAMTHLGVGATGTKYHARWTAPDVIFVHHLGKVTANEIYNTRATAEWNNIKTFWPTAAALDATFRALNRPSAWDIAFFMEGALLSGDHVWADDAAAIIADAGDLFYYNPNSGWYALNIAATIRALVGGGYVATYQAEIIHFLNILIGLCDGDNGVDGYVQDTAYAVMAFNSVGGPARSYANELGRWLAAQRNLNGGWTEPDGLEYPEADGEAIRALSSTIGSNFALDGFEPGVKPVSAWRKSVSDQKTEPFNE